MVKSTGKKPPKKMTIKEMAYWHGIAKESILKNG